MSKLDNLVLLASLFEKRVIEASFNKESILGGSERTSAKRGFSHIDLLKAVLELAGSRNKDFAFKLLSPECQKAIKHHNDKDIEMALIHGGDKIPPNARIILENFAEGNNYWANASEE